MGKKMSDLPKGWECVRLIDFVYSVPTGVPMFSENRKYFSTGSINAKDYIPESEYSYNSRPSRANRIAMKGDIFQARMQNTDKALVIQESLADQLFSTGFLQFRPIAKTYDSKLLFYFVKSDYFLKQRDELATGSTQIALTDTNAVNLKLIVPPLNEQRRIVAKLEKLLHRVDTCKERLEKITAILKRFRQSVLAAACSGRLTADWREKNPNVQPYSVGFQRASDTEYKDDDSPVTWHLTRFGTLTMLVTSGSRGWAKYYADSGSIFIRAQNIKSDFLNFEDIAFVKLPDRAEGLRTRVQQHDILVTITGANVTKSALVEKSIKDAYVSQHVALVRLADVQLSKFLFYYIISLAHGRKQLQTVAYGQGKPGLNLDNIREVIVAVPPLPEQQEIVRRVEALFKKADEIEARYKKAKAFVDKLTQSILVKAFRGKLVPQDPNDESASVLLERIREANTINLQKKRKKSKLEKEKR